MSLIILNTLILQFLIVLLSDILGRETWLFLTMFWFFKGFIVFECELIFSGVWVSSLVWCGMPAGSSRGVYQYRTTLLVQVILGQHEVSILNSIPSEEEDWGYKISCTLWQISLSSAHVNGWIFIQPPLTEGLISLKLFYPKLAEVSSPVPLGY